MIKSKSDSYAAAGVDITAGYKAVELMKNTLQEPRTTVVLMTLAALAAALALTLRASTSPF